MRPDMMPGGVFPDYMVPDHTATPLGLSELQGIYKRLLVGAGRQPLDCSVEAVSFTYG